mgnify:CR=1 FL=1
MAQRNAFLACFCNMSGDLSFTKVCVLILLVMHAFHIAPGVVAEAMLLSAAFGKSTFEGWLQKSAFEASDSNATETKTIIERRVLDKGIAFEPAP